MSASVDGHIAPGFEAVRDCFADIVASSSGTGSALAIWHDGRWVADLWGGFSDAGRTRLWSRDSIVMPYSVTKPFAAVALLQLVDEGRLLLDDPVTRWWPELSCSASVRQLLDNSAGLVLLDEPAPTEAFYDWSWMCRLLEAQRPCWPPGTAIGEAALFYGHLVGEIVRRVDGRSIGQVVAEDVCRPAGLDFCIGVPAQALPRVVDLTGFAPEFSGPEPDLEPCADPDVSGAEPPEELLWSRAMANPPGALDPAVVNGAPWRQAQIPAVNGHGTARAVAGLYLALAQRQLLSADTLHEMTTPSASGRDRVFGDPCQWGLGVAIEGTGWGLGGLGGSLGWWDESKRYALGFVTGELSGSARVDRLEAAFLTAAGG